MKCVFTLAGSDVRYAEMVKVLVVSAKYVSNLELYCLYDGDDESLVQWLSKSGVVVLPWRVSFAADMVGRYRGTKSIQFCLGTYLCTDIPIALRYYGISDEFVLYVDVDTVFLGDIDLGGCRPKYFAAPPDWDIGDWSFVSVGVMLLNTQTLLDSHPAFMQHLRNHAYDFDFAGHGGADQGAWNTFYHGLWDNLGPEYDWKPWWGFNPKAHIVHFSGPKPRDVRAILIDPVERPNDPLSRKINFFVIKQNPDAYRRYLHIWEKYHRMIECQ